MNIDVVYIVYFDNGEMDEWNKHTVVTVCLTKEKAEEYAEMYNDHQDLEKPNPDADFHDGWFYVEEEPLKK